MRAKLDGSEVEVLYRAGMTDKDREDRRNWCVGIAVDESRQKLYWTQKGLSKGSQGRIMCMDLPGLDSQHTSDHSLVPRPNPQPSVLLDRLPEPIDLELDVQTNTLYWSDRGDPPFGNSINAAQLDAVDNMGLLAARILVHRLHEGIGLSLDLTWRRMFFGDLLWGVYTADLDGTHKETLFTDLGDITGILYVGA